MDLFVKGYWNASYGGGRFRDESQMDLFVRDIGMYPIAGAILRESQMDLFVKGYWNASYGGGRFLIFLEMDNLYFLIGGFSYIYIV